MLSSASRAPGQLPHAEQCAPRTSRHRRSHPLDAVTFLSLACPTVLEAPPARARWPLAFRKRPSPGWKELGRRCAARGLIGVLRSESVSGGGGSGATYNCGCLSLCVARPLSWAGRLARRAAFPETTASSPPAHSQGCVPKQEARLKHSSATTNADETEHHRVFLGHCHGRQLSERAASERERSAKLAAHCAVSA